MITVTIMVTATIIMDISGTWFLLPLEGGGWNAMDLGRPSPTAAANAMDALSPMAFLVGVSARDFHPHPARHDHFLAARVGAQGGVGP